MSGLIRVGSSLSKSKGNPRNQKDLTPVRRKLPKACQFLYVRGTDIRTKLYPISPEFLGYRVKEIEDKDGGLRRQIEEPLFGPSCYRDGTGKIRAGHLPEPGKLPDLETFYCYYSDEVCHTLPRKKATIPRKSRRTNTSNLRITLQKTENNTWKKKKNGDKTAREKIEKQEKKKYRIARKKRKELRASQRAYHEEKKALRKALKTEKIQIKTVHEPE